MISAIPRLRAFVAANAMSRGAMAKARTNARTLVGSLLHLSILRAPLDEVEELKRRKIAMSTSFAGSKLGESAPGR